MSERVLGVDVGAETIKLVEIVTGDGELRCTRRIAVEHEKRPAEVLAETLREWEWDGVSFAAATGRFSRIAALAQIPTREALASGFRGVSREPEATLVSIGSRGFSVLEIRSAAPSTFRENSRCSQGTGNFLRQLVERFDLSIEDAAEIAAGVADPAPLSGRCPVILKTDMTHLANKGEDRARILAGLFDAVAENVQVLIKPRTSPHRVFLVGGVTRARRVREHFLRFLERAGMELASFNDGESIFLEAMGCAFLAAEHRSARPRFDDLLASVRRADLERLPPLARSLPRVRRLVAEPSTFSAADPPRDVILGFDIGSTGSKIVVLDIAARASLWEAYGRTNGQPVEAAQSLMRQFLAGPAGHCNVVAAGVTGSGREIVGSLLNTCYGRDAVFVLNEIAAHAEGALSHDARVDTIFEIGGQDAKYIRLAGGRVIDAAMNEACSAGTGSFIEEQGRKFADVSCIAQLGTEAIASNSTVALGQHCSVFMAEVIDEAVASGVERGAILAGIHDSIVQNYLNRVKGSRSVGQVIFCQGMPFAADALAAAVARQTGSDVIVPPNPGTVGALGIALLTAKALSATPQERLDPRRFLDASVEKKDTFVCAATVGCGGAGNRCRIDRILTNVAGERSRFTWGGGCSLYDKGTRRRKLPDLAPDPFHERKELLGEILSGLRKGSGARTIGMADELQLKGLLPFFATFFDKLGLEVVIPDTTDRQALKRGIEEGTVPFCAPMQQFHGAFATVAEQKVDHLFLPMLREHPRVANEPYSGACPVMQGGADVVRVNLGNDARIVSPVIDFGPENLHSAKFLDACRAIAESLGAEAVWKDAHRAAAAAQERFDLCCQELGRRALAFCDEHKLVPVVVVGRPYTIYSTVLNSNVPAILREQGAVPIPLDCYPVAGDVPLFPDVYWAQSQRILRAAHQVRRSPGIYAVYCSNYSCGPDSFTLHFFSYVMEGKPFAVIETDGHSGDAGTKTRIEAFLHCVQEDLGSRPAATPQRFDLLQARSESISVAIDRGDTILVPRLGPAVDAIVACFRGIGARAETLSQTRESLRLGRRLTSGKECLPLILTLGSIVQRLEEARTTGEEFTLLMATTTGPCRFGLYALLQKIVLEKLGWTHRVRVWSPSFDGGYFQGLPKGFDILAFIAITASDLLLEALHHTRPVESTPGGALAIWERRSAELHGLLEEAGRRGLTTARALAQVASGRLFGVAELLRSAADDFAAIDTRRPIPTVEVVGEIYVRCEPFANDSLIERLEERGLRVHLAPIGEWFGYCDAMNLRTHGGLGNHINSAVRHAILTLARRCLAGPLGWHRHPSVDEMLAAAAPYVRDALETESVLTIGNPLVAWRRGSIDAVVSVGPLECMPNKIAEAQFFHVGESERLLSLTLPFNGDPIDTGPLDSFAFEVHERFRKHDRAPSVDM